MRKPVLTVLLAALAVFALPGMADDMKAQGCAGFSFDLTKELKLFAEATRPLTAAAEAGSAPAVEAGKLYEVALTEQTKVRFATAPGKEAAAKPSHAGLLKVVAVKASTVRLTLGAPAWIDVIQSGKVIESSRHTGSHDCKLLRKSVEFSVTPGAEVLIQLSGSPGATVRFALTYP